MSLLMQKSSYIVIALLLLLKLPGVTGAQSTITSVADGNWTDAATWDADVPGENDSVLIEHTVTLDADAQILQLVIETIGALNLLANNVALKFSDGGTLEVLGAIDETSEVRFLGGGELLGNPTVMAVRIAGGVVLSGATITESLILDEGGYIAENPGGDPITDESLIPNYVESTELAFNGTHEIDGPEKGWGDGPAKNPKSILVNFGADVTLNTSKILIGNLIVSVLASLNTNGNLTVTESGNLFNNWVVNGDVTMTTTLKQNEGFRLLSSPVDVQMSTLFEPIWTQGFPTGANTAAGSKNLWMWDNNSTGDSDANWSVLPDITSNLERQSGVLVYVFQDDNAENQDPGSFPKQLSITGELPAEPDDPDLNPNIGGFTLIGNPWFGPLEVRLPGTQGISNILYVYDPNHTAESGDWLTYDLASETGDWDGGRIAPMQSFFVETTGPDPAIDIRQSETANASFFGKTRDPSHVLQLSLEGQGLKSTTWLRFSEDGLMGFDNSDARKLTPLSANHAVLATKSDDILLNMNHLPLLEEQISLPLIAETTKSGEFTLSALQYAFPNDWSVRLKDHQTGETVDVNEDFSYNFSIAVQKKTSKQNEIFQSGLQYSTSLQNRFELIIAPFETTTISMSDSDLPAEIVLNQNYPNPFNPSTVIGYELPARSEVQLEVFDLLGRRVAVLVNDIVEAGSHEVQFNASELASGVYVYRLVVGEQAFIKKLSLIK